MNLSLRTAQWLTWGFLGTIIAAILAVFAWRQWSRPEAALPVYGELKDFSLTNQFSRKVSLDQLKGNIWLADVIFTRCPGPCAAMTKRMREIHQQVPTGSPVQFVSLTADPEFDSPEALKKYSGRFGVESSNWQFLTGPKKQLYDFAIEQLKFSVLDNGSTNGPAIEDRFLHSTQFVLIDPQARIRGYFDGTDQEVSKKVLKAIRALLREEST